MVVTIKYRAFLDNFPIMQLCDTSNYIPTNIKSAHELGVCSETRHWDGQFSWSMSLKNLDPETIWNQPILSARNVESQLGPSVPRMEAKRQAPRLIICEMPMEEIRLRHGNWVWVQNSLDILELGYQWPFNSWDTPKLYQLGIFRIPMVQ